MLVSISTKYIHVEFDDIYLKCAFQPIKSCDIHTNENYNYYHKVSRFTRTRCTDFMCIRNVQNWKIFGESVGIQNLYHCGAAAMWEYELWSLIITFIKRMRPQAFWFRFQCSRISVIPFISRDILCECWQNLWLIYWFKWHWLSNAFSSSFNSGQPHQKSD